MKIAVRIASRPRSLRALIARFGLRTTLLLLLLFVVAILIVDRSRETIRIRGEEVARAHSELSDAAHSGAERQADLIAEAKAILRVAAELPASTANAGSACHDTFKRIDDQLRWLTSLAVFGLDGFPLCSSAEQVVHKSFADRDYFQKALETKDFALSDYIIGRVSGKPVIVLAYPRVKNGVAETILIAAIDLDWMSRAAAEAGSALGAEVLLLDSHANVLAAAPDPQKWMGRNLGEESKFIAALKGASESTDSGSLYGQTYIIGHARLADTNASLAVMLPLDRILAEANQRASYEIGKIVFAGIVSFLVIWLGGELLVMRPIRSLTRGAVLLGSGDLMARIPTQGLAPELRRLGESFNDMAGRLRDREAELRQANERLSELASKDALTGVANRRGFDEQFAAEWNRARRAGESLALLVIDVDHFKRFNDRYGHIEGDSCLRKVAEVLRRTAQRGGDLAARTGGEEFALLLPGADLETAATIAQTVRVEVEVLNIAHKSSPEARVTVSVGAAAMRAGRDENMRILIDLADAALYRAKRAGRNRVVLDQPAVSLAS